MFGISAFSNGTPSTTQSGSFALPNVVIPRILIVAPEPGAPELAATITPEVLPCSIVPTPPFGTFSRSLAVTCEIAPVTTLFFCLP